MNTHDILILVFFGIIVAGVLIAILYYVIRAAVRDGMHLYYKSHQKTPEKKPIRAFCDNCGRAYDIKNDVCPFCGEPNSTREG